MANGIGIQYVSNDSDEGICLARAGEKASIYGKAPVVQADAIVAVTGTVSLTTTINAILTAIRNFGILA